MSKKVIILDPGHGGVNPMTGQYTTAGKRSPRWPDGSIYYEGKGNRNIAELAGRILAAKGAQVFYTVNPSDYTDLSLSKRAARANEIHRQFPQAILCSIHSNGHSNPNAKGYEVYTSPGQTKSDQIATAWLEEHGKLFPDLKRRTDPSDGDPDKEAKFTVLTDTTCPAILIETMFHTNQPECKILMSTCGVRDCAAAIVNALWRF